MSRKLSKKHILTGVLLVIVVPIAVLYNIITASAIQFNNKRVEIDTAEPGASFQANFLFDFVSTSNIGSIAFEFCTNSPILSVACVSPTLDGFDASATILSAQTNNTGFTYDGINSTTNRIVITRASAAGILGPSSYRFDNITNINSANSTVFVRISTHASADGSGVQIDDGSVAYSTAVTGFSVGIFVPPYLTFCVGVIVGPDCSGITSVLTDFGELSSSTTKTATSQFAAATNDFSGYDVYLAGQTLTAGNAIIDPMIATDTSKVGTPQFGINLTSNAVPSVGAAVSGPGTGAPTANYNIPNQFVFINGDIIAASGISSDFSRFTVSHIVNVPDNQSPGQYATTLTYMAVATF